ncbi:MAG TPA: c-type cytochrome biogenesis protein CcmI [Xanthobacteraceae bacterium]|jgi:cytochrome c-type biogenesis protein CcmH
MVLWIIFAFMTAAAIYAVCWPLVRGTRKFAGGSDLLVYKDQLLEIDRDRASGLIGESESEAARLEVSRRLLAAANAPAAKALDESAIRVGKRRRAAILSAAIVLALGVPGLYVALGSPNVPGEPAFARVPGPKGEQTIAALVGQVEANLARNPNDGTGWELIAPVYLRLGRFDDAVQARKKSLALNGESATRQADLGEAEAAAADGVVTADARASFQRAVVLDPHEPKARYFLGLAAEQDGKSESAASMWRGLLADAPPDAPWASFVRDALARLAGNPSKEPGPTASEVAAAGNMSEPARREMISSMVSRLADRLRGNGADVDGWLRLVRAYTVLGDRDKARSAAADAKRALAEHPEDVRQIDDLVKGLGLEG